MSEKRPSIVFNLYSPYMVVGLKNFENNSGEKLKIEPVMSLCRCGHSKFKPFCDGSHSHVGFVGEKDPDRVKDRVKEYVGKEITILDNRGVCSHGGACIRNLPSVFRLKDMPWIDPEGASVRDIVKTIEMCPSGALSYRIGSAACHELTREPRIVVVKNGPLKVEGWIELKDDQGAVPQSLEHYTLCSCGKSKNKPFCDGSHLD